MVRRHDASLAGIHYLPVGLIQAIDREQAFLRACLDEKKVFASFFKKKRFLPYA